MKLKDIEKVCAKGIEIKPSEKSISSSHYSAKVDATEEKLSYYEEEFQKSILSSIDSFDETKKL